MPKKGADVELIKELLDISYTIQSIYDDLADNYYNEEEYKKSLSTLNMCLELENKIYDKIINNKKNLDNNLKRVKYFNQERMESEELKILVYKRIINYIFDYEYLNPFLSMNQNPNIQLEENIIAITNQYYLDYNYLVTCLLEQAINIEDNHIIKELLLQKKYDNIVMNKQSEKSLIKISPSTIPVLENRERLILFNQKQELIKKVYLKESINIIKANINELININNKNRLSLEKKTIKIIALIYLKSALYILEPKEREAVINYLLQLPVLSNDNTETLNDILNIYNELNNNIDNCKKQVRTLLN